MTDGWIGGLVREMVGVAHELTSEGGIQADVTLYPWTGDDDWSKPTFGTAVAYTALVEWKQVKVRTIDGRMVQQQAVVTFLQPIAAVTATGRKNPIDPRDEILLPSGVRASIVPVEGLTDPLTGAPFFPVVSCG